MTQGTQRRQRRPELNLQPDPRVLVTVRQAAKMVPTVDARRGRFTIFNLLRAGKLPGAFKLGGKAWVIPRDQLDDELNNRRTRSRKPKT